MISEPSKQIYLLNTIKLYIVYQTSDYNIPTR